MVVIEDYSQFSYITSNKIAIRWLTNKIADLTAFKLIVQLIIAEQPPYCSGSYHNDFSLGKT
jgi:hypothetical protein